MYASHRCCARHHWPLSQTRDCLAQQLVMDCLLNGDDDTDEALESRIDAMSSRCKASVGGSSYVHQATGLITVRGRGI